METARAAFTSTELHVVPVGTYHSHVSVSIAGVATTPDATPVVTSFLIGMRAWLVSCACAATAPTTTSAAVASVNLRFIGSPRCCDATRVVTATARQWRLCNDRAPEASRRRMNRALQRVHDFGLEALVLRVRDEPLLEHGLRTFQPNRGVGVGRRRARHRGRCGGTDLNAARLGPQFFQFANATLLAPRLVLRLADPIHAFRLILAQSGQYHADWFAAAREVSIREIFDVESRPESPDVHAHFLEVLPANGDRVEAAEETARHVNQPTRRAAD